MMKNIILIFMLSYFAYSQENENKIQMDSVFQISLGPGLNATTCHVVAREPENYNHFLLKYRFDFSDSSLQFSFIDSTSVHISNHVDFKFNDVNFDGYKDLLIVTDESARADQQWSTFLFNPRINQFIFNSAFSDLPDDISIDTIRKTISYDGYSFYSDERVTYFTEYRVIEGGLYISKTESCTDIPKTHENYSTLKQRETKTEYYDYAINNGLVTPITKRIILDMEKDGKTRRTETKWTYDNNVYKLISTKNTILKN